MPTAMRLFGPPAYRLGDERAEWRPLPLDRRGALLALLAQRQEPWPRWKLARLFWPDAAGERARVNLRALLARVRALECGEDVVATPDSLAWAGSSDSWAFRAALAREEWPAAVALGAGTFLQDLDLIDAPEFAAWVELERRELAEAFRTAAERLVEGLARSGDFAAITRLWLDRFEREPLDERTLEGCLRLAAHYGQLRGEALRLLERYGVRLEAELGLPVDAHLAALGEALRRAAPPPPAPAALPSPLAEGGSARSGGTSASRPERPDRGALPTPAAPMIQRDVEVAEVLGLFEDGGARSVLLTGAGGSGKSVLALQVAQQVALQSRGRLAHGCHFVPLAGLLEPELLAATVAASLGVSLLAAPDAEGKLIDFLRGKEALLVLDNLEHLGGSGAFIARLVDACPGLRVLATARAPLAGAGGEVVQVGGLAYPTRADDELFDSYEAVRLLVVRGRQVEPRFALSPANRPAVAAICRLVDGAPLGLELAASWLGTLAPDDIVAALERDRGGLELDLRDVPARHRSLRAAFAHSFGLLAPAERTVLSGLSVFRGGFDLDAAIAVTGCGPAVLLKLLDWSLVRRTAGDRFELHELIRQFAAEALAGGWGDAAPLAGAPGRHGEYYGGLVEREGRWFRGGSAQRAALAAVARELDNVRAAWDWQLREGGEGPARFLAMFHFYDIRGLYQEGAEAFARTAAVLPAAGLARARALTAQAVLLGRLGDLKASLAAVEESLRLLAGLGEEDGLTLMHLGVVRFLQGDLAGAEAAWWRTVAVGRAAGDDWSTCGGLANLAVVAEERGEHDAADSLFAQGMACFERIEDLWGTTLGTVIIGSYLLRRGDVTGARRELERGLAAARDLGQLPEVLDALLALGEVARHEGDLAEEARWLADCVTEAEDAGARSVLVKALSALGGNSRRRGLLSAARSQLLEALALARELGEPESGRQCVEQLAALFAATAQDEVAVGLRELMDRGEGAPDLELALSLASSPLAGQPREA